MAMHHLSLLPIVLCGILVEYNGTIFGSSFVNLLGVRLTFPIVVVEAVSRVVVAEMESCIPLSKKSTTSAKWFDRSCSDAVKQIQTWRQHPNPTSHGKYISARKRTNAIIKRAKRTFIKRKCADLSSSNNCKILWSLTKNISSNFSNSSILLIIQFKLSIVSLQRAVYYLQPYSSSLSMTFYP